MRFDINVMVGSTALALCGAFVEMYIATHDLSDRFFTFLSSVSLSSLAIALLGLFYGVFDLFH